MRPLYRVLRYWKRKPGDRNAVDSATTKARRHAACLSDLEEKATTEFVVGGIAALLDRLEERDRQLLLQAARQLGHQ